MTDELREARRPSSISEYYCGVMTTSSDPVWIPGALFLHGMARGTRSVPEFSTSYYLSSNPDVAAEDINPLVHYVVTGQGEGRRHLFPDRIPASDASKLRSIDEEIADGSRTS